MPSATTPRAEQLPEPPARLASFRGNSWRWLTEHWPLFLVLAVAAFLRFFRLQTIEFDFDQANLFQLAHDAIAHGLIPLSSNESSIGTLHAPFFIYALLPAALTANPLGAAVTVSLCTTAAAGLTYLFTLRYFGRLPSLVAGLLYATSLAAVKYGRGIWQPDILTLFLLLFLFVVFRGAVEHKGGWLAPAVALLAILYQLDPASAVGPAVMLLLALLLAPQTLRWRDVFYAIGALILLFFPYLLLQLLTNFADARSTLGFLQLPAHTDTQVAQVYWSLLFPFNGVLTPWMNLVGYCLMALLLLGVLTAVLRLLRPLQLVSAPAVATATTEARSHWLSPWQQIRLNQERGSLLLLLTWQIAPFANLIHHAVDLHMQYLLVFLPGPFILIGLAIDEGVHNLTHWQPRRPAVSIGMRGVLQLVTAVLIIGQSVGTTVNLFQATGGQFNDRGVQTISYSNDLNSLWNAVHQADALAQQRHIQRLFINMDATTQPAITYLSTTMKTPTTDFGNDECLLLPASGTGAAVYLIGPYVDDIDALLRQFATVTLVAQPPRLSGKPFSLYIVTPKPMLPGLEATTITGQNNTLAVSHWQIRRNAPTATRTLYNYQFTRTTATTSTLCTISALHAHDQLLVAFPLVSSVSSASSVQLATSNTILGLPSIQATAFDTVPTLYHVGPFEFTTFLTKTVNRSFTEDVQPVT